MNLQQLRYIIAVNRFRNFAKYVRGEAVNPYTYEYEAKLHDLILLACS